MIFFRPRSAVGSNALDRWSVSGTCQGCSSVTQQPPISEMAEGQVSASERSHLSVLISGKLSIYCRIINKTRKKHCLIFYVITILIVPMGIRKIYTRFKNKIMDLCYRF